MDMYSYVELTKLSTICDDIHQQDNVKVNNKEVPQNDDPEYTITYADLLHLRTDVDYS